MSKSSSGSKNERASELTISEMRLARRMDVSWQTLNRWRQVGICGPIERSKAHSTFWSREEVLRAKVAQVASELLGGAHTGRKGARRSLWDTLAILTKSLRSGILGWDGDQVLDQDSALSRLQSGSPMVFINVDKAAQWADWVLKTENVDTPNYPTAHYFSTACLHEVHDECGQECKFCSEQCRCDCHAG